MLRDEARAADREHRRIPGHLAQRVAAHRDHADAPLARDRVGHHGAIARLEDVQRRRAVGEKRWAREREDRQRKGHRRNLLDRSSRCRDAAAP